MQNGIVASLFPQKQLGRVTSPYHGSVAFLQECKIITNLALQMEQEMSRSRQQAKENVRVPFASNGMPWQERTFASSNPCGVLDVLPDNGSKRSAKNRDILVFSTGGFRDEWKR